MPGHPTTLAYGRAGACCTCSRCETGGLFFSSPELIGWDSSRRQSVHPSVRASTLSNMNISETSRPITTKFYLKHHWGGGKAALGFDADQIRTLVSMATDSSHRVIMGEKGIITFSQLFLIGSFLYLQVTMTYIRACMSSKFGRIRPRTTELAALERRKNSHRLIMGKTMSSHFLGCF